MLEPVGERDHLPTREPDSQCKLMGHPVPGLHNIMAPLMRSNLPAR